MGCILFQKRMYSHRSWMFWGQVLSQIHSGPKKQWLVTFEIFFLSQPSQKIKHNCISSIDFLNWRDYFSTHLGMHCAVLVSIWTWIPFHRSHMEETFPLDDELQCDLWWLGLVLLFYIPCKSWFFFHLEECLSWVPPLHYASSHVNRHFWSS